MVRYHIRITPNDPKYKNRLDTDVILKRSLHFTLACHLTEAAEAAVAAARGSGE